MTAIRNQAIVLGVRLVLEECCNCGVAFAMTEELRDRRLNDRRTFYCPNGHGQAYTGQTEAEKLRQQLQAAETRARNAEGDASWYRDQHASAQRSLAATRGVVTRMRKRAAAGTCPFGCRRHFTNLERHVASKHPGQVLEGES